MRLIYYGWLLSGTIAVANLEFDLNPLYYLLPCYPGQYHILSFVGSSVVWYWPSTLPTRRRYSYVTSCVTTLFETQKFMPRTTHSHNAIDSTWIPKGITWSALSALFRQCNDYDFVVAQLSNGPTSKETLRRQRVIQMQSYTRRTLLNRHAGKAVPLKTNLLFSLKWLRLSVIFDEFGNHCLPILGRDIHSLIWKIHQVEY